MENERDDRVIFLKDLLFAALYQWRRILIAALVLAVLFGVYAGFNEWKRITVPQSKEQYLLQLEEYNKGKSLLEARIAATQEYLAGQKKYLEEAPLMQLNAYQLYEAVVVFSVQSEYQIQPGMFYQNPDNLQALLHSYTALLESEQVLQAMAQVIDVPAKYVKDLIQIQSEDVSTRTLGVGIRYSDAQQAQAMMDAVVACIQINQPQIAESIGNHQLLISTRSVTEIMDSSIIEEQTKAYSHQQELAASLQNMEQQLSQMRAPQYGVKSSTKEIVLFVLLGGFLGAFLVAGWACLCHIAGAKVYSVRTLKNRTGVKVLGSICSESKLHPIDLWLRNLEGRNIDSQHAAFLAAAVSTCCTTGAKVLLAGSCDEAVRQDLLQALNAAGITATDCGSLLTSAQALQTLAQQDAVVLLAQCGNTPYRLVEEEMEIIADRSKLLGCILVNG